MVKLGSRSPLSRGCSALAFLLAFMLCLLTLAPAMAAQSEDAVHVLPRSHARPNLALPEFDPKDSLRVDVDLVLVPVTITDAGNRPVTSLRQQDFSLFEAGQPQQIRYFSTEDGPISIGIILDLSKSMSNKIDEAREALSEFFKTAHPEDDYFVITFADRPQVLSDATRSIGTIQGKLAAVIPSGHTALLDAIYLGLAKMRSARYRRHALLIISDGGDNRSRYTPREIKSMVEEADVQIYAIGLFDHFFRTPEEWAGKRLLTGISEATGGRTITLRNVRKLPQVAATISRELRSQYVIGYLPSNPVRDGKWRQIKVALTRPPGGEPLQVYAKRGYLGPAK